MSQMVRYEKKMRDRAKTRKRWLATISVDGKHLKDDSCTVQGLVDLAMAKRLTKMAMELLKVTR